MYKTEQCIIANKYMSADVDFRGLERLCGLENYSITTYFWLFLTKKRKKKNMTLKLSANIEH